MENDKFVVFEVYEIIVVYKKSGFEMDDRLQNGDRLKISKLIYSDLEFKINEVHFWTNSLVILKQIRSECKKFLMFIACRIGENYENTEAQWDWIPTNQNVNSATTVKHVDWSPDIVEGNLARRPILWGISQ